MQVITQVALRKNLTSIKLQFNIIMPVAKKFRQINTNTHVQWTLKTCI